MSDPKKPKRKPVTKKTKTTPTSKENTNIPVAENINIEHLFSQALNRHKDNELKDKKAKLKEIAHLSLIAEEYMSAFALIGYSLQDEQVIVFNASTPKDEAALADLLRATFLNIASNRP